jgi:hypothetical protein
MSSKYCCMAPCTELGFWDISYREMAVIALADIDTGDRIRHRVGVHLSVVDTYDDVAIYQAVHCAQLHGEV